MFADRRDAGRQLADRLKPYRDKDAVVLALPRGGVPVAFEIAQAISAPLDLIFAAKLCAPDQPELAAAAIADCHQLRSRGRCALRCEEGEGLDTERDLWRRVLNVERNGKSSRAVQRCR